MNKKRIIHFISLMLLSACVQYVKTFPFNFSIMVKWNDLDQHLASFNREVVVVWEMAFAS